MYHREFFLYPFEMYVNLFKRLLPVLQHKKDCVALGPGNNLFER